MIKHLLILSMIAMSFTPKTSAQTNKTIKTITLEKAISIATDSSLNAIIAKNQYLSGYWRYRSYKANRLPSLSLKTNPLQYNRNFIKRYDSESNIDTYKSQQSFYSSANLSLTQNVDFTGGTLFIDTDIGYFKNFGANKYEQFSSVPIRIGYSQSLFGYNDFKWEKKLEPLNFRKIKKEVVSNLENISGSTINYFFNHLLNKILYDLSKKDMMSRDTLYMIGKERHKIGTISQADLLTLKLDYINAKNEVQNSKISLKRSSIELANFLRLKSNIKFNLILPKKPTPLFISQEEALKHAKINNPKMLDMEERLLQAHQSLDKKKKESRFSASISASVGFNQVAGNFMDAYRKPLEQDIVNVSMTIPILDWGVKKGNVNMAQSDLNITKITLQQEEQALEQEIMITVSDFNIRMSQIQSADEARKVAEMAYNETKQHFLIGKTTVMNLNSALKSRTTAQTNYIKTLKEYWECYYKIRKLTLYDFKHKQDVAENYKNIIELKDQEEPIF